MKDSKKWIIAISLIFMFCPKYLPPLFGLNQTGSITLGIAIGTLILLLSVSLSWPVFLCMFAFAFNGVYTLNEVLRMCMGNSLLWFMMLNGVLISSIEKTGLYRRAALWIACRLITRKSPWLFLFALLLSCLLCGSLMNTTAVYLLFLALSTEVLQQLRVEKGHPFAGIFMIAVMAVSNISHAITPFGHSVTIMVAGEGFEPSTSGL